MIHVGCIFKTFNWKREIRDLLIRYKVYLGLHSHHEFWFSHQYSLGLLLVFVGLFKTIVIEEKEENAFWMQWKNYFKWFRKAHIDDLHDSSRHYNLMEFSDVELIPFHLYCPYITDKSQF